MSEHIAATMQLVAADGPLIDELADVEGGRWRHRWALLYKWQTELPIRLPTTVRSGSLDLRPTPGATLRRLTDPS